MPEPGKKPTLDERIQALVENAELLNEMMKDGLARTEKLEALIAAHDREWQRFRKAMRAALQAWLSDYGDEGQES